MKLKSVLYNSVTVSLPKNAVQFLLGVVLFWLVYGSLNFFTASIAMASFLIAYSSVYFFNDISDYDEDRQDSEKAEWKLVANGTISKRTAAIAGISLLFSGMAIASFVNMWFVLLLGMMIILNLLHSSPYIRLKKRLPAAAANLTAIEFLKYSSGWFALTTELTTFPFWIIFTFSIIYSVIYLVYKFRFKGRDIISNKHVLVPMGVASAFAYVVSIILYDFALPMILLLGLSILLAKFGVGKSLRFKNWLMIEYAVLPMIVLSFLILSIPTIAQANNNISITIDQYKQIVYDELPSGMVDGIKNLTPGYASLDELQEAINQSLNLSSLSFLEAES